MTYAPASLLDWRRVFTRRYPHIPATQFGIVGGPSHVAAGTSYHLGLDQLKMSRDPYSARTRRDRNGLTNAASAGDITDGIGPSLLRELSQWIVAECRRGAADSLDIREVIFSPDGNAVLTWDRERGVGSFAMPRGDASHRRHTHVSWYRDSEFKDRASLFERFFQTHTSKKDGDVFFLRSPSVDRVFVSNGVSMRAMPGGTWESTIEPLVNSGHAVILDYPNMEEILKAGGPLDEPLQAIITDEQLERVLRKVLGSLG